MLPAKPSTQRGSTEARVSGLEAGGKFTQDLFIFQIETVPDTLLRFAALKTSPCLPFFLPPPTTSFLPSFLTHLFTCGDEQFVISPDTNGYGRTRHGWWGQRGGVKEAL